MSPAYTYSRVRRATSSYSAPREGAAEHREVVAVERGWGGVARAVEGVAHARRRGRRRAVVRGEPIDEHGLAGGDVVAQPYRQEHVDVGDAEVIAHRVGQDLEVAHGVVAEQADEGLGFWQLVARRACPLRQRGQPGRLQQRLERGERGGARPGPRGRACGPPSRRQGAAGGDAHDPAARAVGRRGPGEVVPASQLRRSAGRVERSDWGVALEPERADEDEPGRAGGSGSG